MSVVTNKQLLARKDSTSVEAVPSDKLLRKPETPSRIVTLYVGKSNKAFDFASTQLAAISPYFCKGLAEQQGHDGMLRSPESETFPDLDELAMALFSQWLANGPKLAGPDDFHSLHHYLGLYVLARKFEIEVLQNDGQPLSCILFTKSEYSHSL
jgi:hypothetical protein